MSSPETVPPKPIVCWDFDETLGYFRPLEFRFLGEPIPAGMPPVRLKPGIRELLGSLQEFSHVVTTAAIGAYAREVLQEYGLLELFEQVFGREDGIFRGDGKDYKIVGDSYGIDEKELCHRLVIVGNDEKRDPDYRYRQIVMIYDDQMVDLPSEPIGVVLRRLLLHGEGDMKRGFDRLMDMASGVNKFNPLLLLEQGVSGRIDYWGSFVTHKLHPMIIAPRAA